MAYPNTAWYVDSVSYAAIAAWATGTAKTVGQTVRQLAAPTLQGARVFVCIVAGTTHASTEPTWVLTRGGKTTDNSVTWMECTGQAAICGDATNTVNWNSVKTTIPSLGVIIKNVAADHYFICTTSGTTGSGAEPTWNTTTGATTADNTVTWTCLGAVGAFTAYLNASKALYPLSGVGISLTPGDIIYVGDDHVDAATSGENATMGGTSAAPINIYCADHTKAPPASADLKTTGVVSSTAGFATFAWTDVGYIYGLAFNASNTSLIGVNGTVMRLDHCSFSSDYNANQGINFASAGVSTKVLLTDCSVSLTNAGGAILIGSGVSSMVWRNPAGGAPFPTLTATTIFQFGTGGGGQVLLDGLDLNGLSGKTLLGTNSSSGCGRLIVDNCKLPASFTVVTGGTPTPGLSCDLINCDSGTATYRHERWAYEGNSIIETTVIRTSGATDNATGVSWKISTTATSKWHSPFESFPLAVWNTRVGANVTATITGIWNAAAVPNNDDIWADFEYMGSAVTPIATFVSGTKANNLAANAALTADTSAWDSLATARANTHVYTTGDIIKLASNMGRLFFCTTGGTSSGSEPGGYASAVDGGSVTDGTAVFRAGCRFSLTATFSSPQPQLAGYVCAAVKAARASGVFYVDPKIVLS